MNAADTLLSPDQAVLWNLERQAPGLHVGGLALVDGEIDRQELLHWMTRLRRLPRFGLRVERAMYGPPRWRSASFNLEKHLHVVSNDAPESALDEALSRPLRPGRPLWEFHLAPGYHERGDALLVKAHLVAVDGLATSDFFHALFASGADVDEKKAASQTTNGARTQAHPTEWLENWTQAGQNLFDSLRDIASEETRTAVLTLNETMPDIGLPPPALPFNRRLSGRRRLIRCAFPYADIRAIRARLGGTLSDVVVAVTGGAIKRYLLAEGVPIRGRSLRVALATDLAEHDRKLRSLLPVEVPLDLGAAERLRAVHQLARLLRAARVADVLARFTGLQGTAGPTAATAIAVSSSIRPPFHLTVANANGPQIPQFLAGRPLLGYTPSWPTGLGQGLSCAFLAYDQSLHVGITVDERTCPDAETLPRLFAESFAELLDAGGSTPGRRLRLRQERPGQDDGSPPLSLPAEPRPLHNMETP